MTEKILILFLFFCYMGSFITRNLLVKLSTGKPVRSPDRIVTASIISSSLCFVTTIASVFSNQWYHLMGEIHLLRNPIISFAGLSFFAASTIMGWIVSAQLRDSWRVGVFKNEKTRLITHGIYAHIRNPYFLSYYVMYSGLFLVRPSIILLMLTVITGSIFHRIVLNEEAHLLRMHGDEYKSYANKTGRYIP